MIVGGGPVGLATALYAVRAGLVPLVLEPRVGARVDKACGEGLMPGAVAALRGLGVEVGGRPITGIRYVHQHRSVTADFRAGPGRGVRRTELHAAMSAATRAAGVQVVRDAMAGLTQSTSGVRVRLAGSARAVEAGYAVAADGLHSPTRRSLGLDRQVRGPRRHGLRRHFRVAPWTDHVEVHWGAHSEAYVTPVGDDLVGVAVLTAQRRGWQPELAQFPALLHRLDGAEAVTGVRGAGPLRQRVSSRALGRVLLVGDAGGYVDALTGEGIAVGLAQAAVAIDSIATGRPERYPAAAARVSRSSTILTAGMLAATRPHGGRRMVLGAATRAPWLFGRAVDVLTHVGPERGPIRAAAARPA